eukprot:scaffold412_cov311-Pavlova_lutheri.AAC.38
MRTKVDFQTCAVVIISCEERGRAPPVRATKYERGRTGRRKSRTRGTEPDRPSEVGLRACGGFTDVPLSPPRQAREAYVIVDLAGSRQAGKRVGKHVWQTRTWSHWRNLAYEGIGV